MGKTCNAAEKNSHFNKTSFDVTHKLDNVKNLKT